MHTARPTIHRSRSPQPVPAGAVPPMSADWDPWHEQLSDASVLPAQFFGSQPSLYTGRPAAALLRAVLEDTLACFQKQFVTEGRRVQRMAREAEEWFLSEEAHWPFSFVSVCAVLGLEPESVRQQLKRWSHSHLQTPQGKIPWVAARPRRGLPPEQHTIDYALEEHLTCLHPLITPTALLDPRLSTLCVAIGNGGSA